MGGCTSCGSKAGCDHRKGVMLEAIDDAMARLYPTRRWGELDDAARAGAGVSEEEGAGLAAELASELGAAAFFVPGGDEAYCDFIHVLCVGREPCLVQVRDFGVPLPAELRGEPVRELYLRVCLSHLARMAGVQQVAIDLDWAGGDPVLRERPRAGVFDAPLLSRMQRLVAVLPAYDLLHVDFGDISSPPPGFDPGEYPSLYGASPATANYLFFADPLGTDGVRLL
jgi:hypothetical protein